MTFVQNVFHSGSGTHKQTRVPASPAPLRTAARPLWDMGELWGARYMEMRKHEPALFSRWLHGPDGDHGGQGFSWRDRAVYGLWQRSGFYGARKPVGWLRRCPRTTRAPGGANCAARVRLHELEPNGTIQLKRPGVGKAVDARQILRRCDAADQGRECRLSTRMRSR